MSIFAAPDLSVVVPADTTIEIGHHITFSWLGHTWNADTMWSTAIAALIVIVLGLVLRANVTGAGVPSKLQIFWETVVNQVTSQVEQSMGRVNNFVVPLGITLFLFILFSNWLELIPTGEKVPPPTADVNLTYAMAIFVIVGVHIYSIRVRGFGGYIKHYFQPVPALSILNIIEEITKPITLALRLFGNVFSGGIMLAIIGLLPFYISWLPDALWRLFDMGIGAIQAFIFGLLTIIYFGLAGDVHSAEEGGEGHGGGASAAPDSATETTDDTAAARTPAVVS